jgi:hypothetical protein
MKQFLENVLNIDLTHFDDGGAAGDAGASAGDTGGSSGDTSGAAAGDPGGEGAGSNEPGNAGQGTTPSPEERAAAYKQFKAEYKDLYDKEVQDHITRRMKKYTGLEQNLNELNADVNEMLKMLNVTDRKQALAELKKIQLKRMEDEAYDRGMDVETYRREKERERRLAEYEARERQQYELRQKASRYQADAVELQKTYPDFSLRAEALNPQFLEIVDKGGSVKFAYETVHAPEILSKKPEFAGFDFKNWQPNDVFFTMLENGFPIDNAFKTSEMDWWEANIAKQMEKRTADNIKASGNRPKENGANKSPAVNLKKNPSAMTGKEVKDLADQILRGEIKPEDVKF